MAVKSSSVPLPLIVAAVAVIAVTLAYTFLSSGRGGGGGGGDDDDVCDDDDHEHNNDSSIQKDRSESDATPRTENFTAPNESSLSLVSLQASASEREAAHRELTFEEEIMEEAATATLMEKSEVAKARALKQFPGSMPAIIKAPLSEPSQEEVAAAEVNETLASPTTSEHKRKTEPSSPMKPKHKEFRPALIPDSMPATPIQHDGDDAGGLLEHKRKSATSPTKPKHKEFRSTPNNPDQDDDSASGFGEKEFRPKLVTLPDGDEDEGEHSPKPAVSPTKPKSKKIRPKLTPDSTQDGDDDEEGDLGFGDIVATSTTQSTTITKAPSVDPPTAESTTTKASPPRRSTTTKLIKLDDSDEDIETPGEGADYSKISSYWKFKDNKNVFVPQKSKKSVSYSGSIAAEGGGPLRSKLGAEEEGGGWERAMSRRLQAVEKEAEAEEAHKMTEEEEEGSIGKSEETQELQETVIEEEVSSLAAVETTETATKTTKSEDDVIELLQETTTVKEVVAVETTETAIEEEATNVAAVEVVTNEETEELQETTIGEDVSSLAAVETTSEAITEWKKEIFASVLNVEQVQSKTAIYGHVIDAEAARAKNLEAKPVDKAEAESNVETSVENSVDIVVEKDDEVTGDQEADDTAKFGEEAEWKPETTSKTNENDNNDNEPEESNKEPEESNDNNSDEDDSNASDPQLIVPSASDESSGSSKGSQGYVKIKGGQGYVKIVRTSTGDAMTESEFLSRPMIDAEDAPPAATSGELLSQSQETATSNDNTAEVVLKDDEIKRAVIAGDDEAGGDAEGIVAAVAAPKTTTVDKNDNDEVGGDVEGIVAGEVVTAIADDSNIEEGAETDANATTDTTSGGNANKKKGTNKKKKKKKGKKK